MTGLQTQQDAQNISFRDSSPSVTIPNATARIGKMVNFTGSLPNGTIIQTSLKNLYGNGAVNISWLYNATNIPVFPQDIIGWMNVTAGNWQNTTSGLSIPVVIDGNLGLYVDSSADNVNVTTAGLIFRRS